MNRLRSIFRADTLQKRLIAYLLPLTLLPIAVFAFLLYTLTIQDQIAIIQEREETRLLATGDLLNQSLRVLDDDIRFLSEIPNTLALGRAWAAGDAATVASAQAALTADFVALSRERGIYDQVRFIAADGEELVRVDLEDGETLVIDESALQNKGDRSYFVNSIDLPRNAIFVSPLNLNREGSPPQIELVNDQPKPVLRYAKPVYVQHPTTGQTIVAGVVVTNVLAESILNDLVPDIGDTFLINADGYFLYNSLNPNLTFGFEEGIQALEVLNRPSAAETTFEAFYGADATQVLQAPIFAEQTQTADGTYLLNYQRIAPPSVPAEYYWVLATARDTSTLFASVQQVTLTIVIVTLIFGTITVVAVSLIARYVANPIRSVSDQAENIARGEFTIGDDDASLLRREDEIGKLVRSFRAMSSQVQVLVNTLEQRVAARTSDLETSAEIAAAANQVRQLEDLLSLTVNLLRDRFDFYYVQIYLIDEAGQNAVLREGTGYVGRQLLAQNWQLPLDGRSLVAEAIRTGQDSVVQDTANDPNFLPNALLPQTRAELTVPLRAENEVIGALDIQHNVPNPFGEETRKLFQTLADQLAVTFMNLRLLESAERRARELTTVAEVSLEASSTLDIDTLLRSVTRLTRDNFNLYHAHVYLLNEERTRLELVAGSGEVGMTLVQNQHGIAYDEEHSLVARAARLAQPMLANDVSQNPNYLPNPLLPDTRSELAVPMSVAGEIIGVMDVQSDVVNRFTDEDIQVHSTLAQQVAVAINNARTFDAVIRAQEVLAENEARLSAVTANFPNGAIVMYDHDMRYLLVDGLGLEEAGLNKAAMEGRTVDEIFPAEQVPGVRESYQRALDGHYDINEIPYGNLIYRTYSLPVRDESGLIIAAMTITQNITESKQQEYEREVLLRVASELNNAVDANGLLAAILSYPQSQNLASANLFYIENNSAGQPLALEVVANWAVPDVPVTPVGTRFNVADFEAVQAWLQNAGQPTLYGDIMTDSRVDAASRATYEQFGTQASVILPLYGQNRWVGLYLLSWLEPKTFAAIDERIYAAIMRQAIPTVEAVRAAESTQRARARAELLASINAALSQATDEQGILRALSYLVRSNEVSLTALNYLNTSSQGTTPDTVDIVAALDSSGATIPLDIFPATRVAAAEHPVLALVLEQPDNILYSEDVAQDERMANEETQAFLQASNAQALIFVPLISGVTVLGVLSVSWAQPRSIDPEFLSLLKAVQPPFASVVASRRAYLAQQTARNRADTLSTINLELSRTQTPDDLLGAVATFAERFEPMNIILSYIDSTNAGEPSRITAVAAWHDGIAQPDNPLLWQTFPIGAFPVAQLMFETPTSPLIINDVDADERLDVYLRELLHQLGGNAFIVLPLRTADVWQGTLTLTWALAREVTEDEQYIYTRLIQPLSVVVANLRTTEQTERRARELEAAAEISTATASQLKLEDLLFAVADLTKERFNRYHAHIYLLDANNNSLVLAAGAGETGRRMVAAGYRININQDSIVARCARNRSVEVIHDTFADPDFLPNPLLPDTKSELAVPIIYSGRLLGVLDIQDDKTNQFSDMENQVKVTLANQIAISIENARSFERIQQQSTIVTTSTDFISIAGLDQHIQYLNPNGLAMTGYSENEVDKMSVKQFYDAAEYERIEQDVLPTVMAGGTWRGELHLLRKDGTSIPVDQTVFVIRDEEGNVTNLATIATDITERKRNEAELIIRNAAIESSTVGVSIADVNQPDMPLIYVNETFQRITGYSYEEAVGRNWRFLQNEDHEQPELDILRAALNDGRSVTVTLRNYRKDGTLFYNEQSISPVRNEAGQLTHFVGIFSDVTERVQSEEEQQALLLSAQLLNEARTPDDLLTAAISYAVTHNAQMALLFYLESDMTGRPEVGTAVATWALDGTATIPTGTKMHYDDSALSDLFTADPYNPVFIDDSEKSPVLDEAGRAELAHYGLRAMVAMPLYTQRGWIARILIGWHEPHRFTDLDHRIYGAILRQTVGTADALRAADATRRAQEEAQRLYRISAAVNEATEVPQLLEAILKNNAVPDAADMLLLTTWQNLDHNLASYVDVSAAWARTGDNPFLNQRMSVRNFPFYSVLRPDSVAIIESVASDAQLDEVSRGTLTQLGVASFLSAPLVGRERWLGNLTLTSAEVRAFNVNDVRLLRAIASVAASALDRFDLLKETIRRASELETVAVVSAAAATILDVGELLQSVADLTKQSFDLYHAHIYLLRQEPDRPKSARLVLSGGAGEAGRRMKESGHSIPLNANSVVARAARSREGLIVNDTTLEPDFLPNPLLPETKSELAVPMIVGDTLVGVLDVQSNQLNRFTDEDVRLKTTLADQIAVAVQNAEAYERERRAVDYYREADRLKQEFLANMSHELRTPLNSIIGYSEVLLDGVDGELEEEAVEDVQAIYTSGKHLLSIINEILDLAKIDAGQMELSIKKVELTDLLQEAVKSSQIQVKDKPVTMSLIEENAIPPVFADPVRTTQIMLNIIGNAVKFTEEGSITVSYGMRDDDNVFVSIADTGIGMEESMLEVIFERFRQVDGSSTRRAGGTGLGLALTRQFLLMQGGDIRAESVPGEGSTFTFWLPVYKGERQPEIRTAQPETGD